MVQEDGDVVGAPVLMVQVVCVLQQGGGDLDLDLAGVLTANTYRSWE